METKDWNLWNNITFKTTSYYKNFDLTVLNDSVIIEHSGEISEIRIQNNEPPILIGEFGISVWNIKLAVRLGIDIHQLLKDHQAENVYNELMNESSSKFDIYRYNNIVLIQNLILRPDYRKRGITEEFVESVYRGFFDENNAVIALVKPLQENPIDIDFFLNHKQVEVRKVIKDYHNVDNVPARTYYSVDDLFKKTDKEMNEYKLFAIANRCGFSRIGDSHLFMLTPEKMLERIQEKRTIERKLNNSKY